MRFRTLALAIFLVASSFAIPNATHAASGIPFFGPIIPQAGNQAICPASWGMVIVVINNILKLLLSIVIVFIAPLSIAYAGFVLVIGQGNPGEISRARNILLHTIVGIVVAMAAWMIVAALLAVLMGGKNSSVENWTNLISAPGADPCLNVAGSFTQTAAPAAKVPSVPSVVCSVQPLSKLTDPLALQMEGGETVIWENTDPQLKKCADKFIGKVGGTVTSVYRPQAYQTHLFEIQNKWCAQGLKSNKSEVCSSLRVDIANEVSKHFGFRWDCGAVAQNSSSHSSGTGIDISGIDQNLSSVKTAASESCLDWKNYSGDPYHYDLKQNCTCS